MLWVLNGNFCFSFIPDSSLDIISKITKAKLIPVSYHIRKFSFFRANWNALELG